MRLEVLDFEGPTKWRFRLTDAADAFLADHVVELDAEEWQFEAFTDLRRYLRWNATPDRLLEHEAELVAAVGEWITTQVLGPVGAILAQRRKAVRLELPPNAAVLGYLPWELARVNGQTLAEHRVNVIIDQLPPPNSPRREVPKEPVGDRLRMLAVFSLPDGTGALNLRRERHELTKMVQRIAKVNNKAIELRVLQYGATRERLEEALLEQPGWDVVHLSGHGLAGGLVLENDAGGHDLIPSTELVDLLDYGSDQIKLIVLSACESAAVTAEEHLRLLNLAPGTRTATDPAPTQALPAVAAEIVSRLDCAVLAMRYPVVDDFAIALARSFYDLTLGKGQSVPRALGLTLSQPKVAPSKPTPGAPALSIGTPALFGPRAEVLKLIPPTAAQQHLPPLEGQRLASFPDQPERFVGRVSSMTRAATALAPQSGRSGVMFHGMAGAGKTTCAVELAYTHHESFPGGMAWYTAPPLGQDISTALTDFALRLEHRLGIKLAHRMTDAGTLQQSLPSLTQLLEDNRLLIVVDNAESLLTEQGAWRDERWGLLITAMTNHRGLSRLVLTSRTPIAGLAPSVLVEAVHGLSLRESVLLARELPNLSALIDAQSLPAGLDAEQARGLAARVLSVVQGHPKLIELADGQATDPARLRERLDEADRTWLACGTHLQPFLAGDDPAPTDTAYLSVLQDWTRSAATTLNPDAMLLLQMLCCTEADDRDQFVLEGNWADVWRRLQQAGEPPDPGPLLAELAARALLADTTLPDTGGVIGWRIHPGIADTIRTSTDPTITTAVETELGNYWLANLAHALDREQTDELGWLVLRAARSAVPYLLRQRRWYELGHAAEELLHRDRSTATTAALLPMLEIAATTDHKDNEHALGLSRTHALALIVLNPQQGAIRLQNLLHIATTAQRWGHAQTLMGDLVDHHMHSGRLHEALALADALPEYTRRAGQGPWTQLQVEGRRLWILGMLGEYQQVLEQVRSLREQMATLPDPPDPNDSTIDTWNVRETLLQVGMFAARDLRDWPQALDFNAEILASQQARGASAHQRASTRFNDYGPLLQSGQIMQARNLLIGCRTVFEDTNDINALGRTLSALALVENNIGHLERAIELETDALRYKYMTGDPKSIAASHNNLAKHLSKDNHNPRMAWAHSLADAIVCYQTGDGTLTTSLRNLAQLLTIEPGTQPTTIADVCTLVEHIDGVHLTQLLAHLPQRVPDSQTAMNDVLHLAAQATTDIEEDVGARIAELQAAVVAAAQGDPDANLTIEPVLEQMATNPDLASLVTILRQIVAGERNPSLDQLDPNDTEFVKHVLAQLATPASNHVEES